MTTAHPDAAHLSAMSDGTLDYWRRFHADRIVTAQQRLDQMPGEDDRRSAETVREARDQHLLTIRLSERALEAIGAEFHQRQETPK